MGNKDNSKRKLILIKDIAIPAGIVIASLFIGFAQIISSNNIAKAEREVKLVEIIIDDISNTDNTERKEISLALLSVIDEEIADEIIKKSVDVTIRQFHRAPNMRENAARFMASLYPLNKKYVVNNVIAEIKYDTGRYYENVNKAVVFSLLKIKSPNEWIGTDEQFQKLKRLKELEYFDIKPWDKYLDSVLKKYKNSEE